MRFGILIFGIVKLDTLGSEGEKGISLVAPSIVAFPLYRRAVSVSKQNLC